MLLERARAEYSKGQQLIRQWNAEIVEYERMKAYMMHIISWFVLFGTGREYNKLNV